MNKYAAEKIAQEYYGLGMQIAEQDLHLVKQSNMLTKGLATARNLAKRHVLSRKPIGGMQPQAFKEFRAGFPKQLKGMSGGEYVHNHVRPYVQKQSPDIRMGLDQYIASRPGSVTPSTKLLKGEGYQMTPEYAEYWANSLNPNSIIHTRRADAAASYFGR